MRSLSWGAHALLLLLWLAGPASAQASRLLDDEGKLPEDTVVVYPILGTITSGSYAELERDVDHLVEDLGARIIVFEISSPGGEVQAGMDTAAYIFDLHRNRAVDVYAYIASKTHAYSAAAMIALAAPTIVMGEDSQIGDIIPIHGLTGAELGSKVAYYAEQNAYPVALAQGMVSRDLVIYELKGGQIDGLRFVTGAILENYLESHPGERARLDPFPVCEKGHAVVLSENEAWGYKIAQKISPSVDHMITDYGLSGEILRAPQDFDNLTAKITDASWARFLDLPFIKFLLIVIGIIGVAIEFKMPSTLLPGGIGLGAFLLFFLGGWANGNVVWLEITLFLAAGVLIACEIFVIPGFGVAGLSGLALLFASLVLSLRPSDSLTAEQFVSDSVLIVGSLTAGVVGIVVALWALPRFGIGTKSFVGTMTLNSETSIPGIADSDNFDHLREQLGTIQHACRPAGKALIDGREYDVVAERGFIDRAKEVEVIEVHGNRIVVREVRS